VQQVSHLIETVPTTLYSVLKRTRAFDIKKYKE